MLKSPWVCPGCVRECPSLGVDTITLNMLKAILFYVRTWMIFGAVNNMDMNSTGYGQVKSLQIMHFVWLRI